MGNSLGGRANNIYPPGSDKLNEVQVYMSTRRPVIRAFSDVEKLIFLISDLAVKAARSENRKDRFSTSEKALISSQVKGFIHKAGGGNSHFVVS